MSLTEAPEATAKFLDRVSAAWEYFTPESAQKYLDTMHENRAKSTLNYVVMEENLRNDTFVPAISTVYFDGDDRAWDGQHRFQAIVNTGIGAWLHVVRGVTAEEAEYIDTGRKRGIGDILRISTHKKSTSAIGAVAKLIATYHKGGIEGLRGYAGYPVTQAEIMAAAALPGVEDATAIGLAINRKLTATPSVAGFGAWLTRLSGDGIVGDIDPFWPALCGDGADLTGGSPILAVRNRYLNPASGRSNVRAEKRLEDMFVLFRGWNGYVRNERLMRIQLTFDERPNGKKYFSSQRVPDLLRKA